MDTINPRELFGTDDPRDLALKSEAFNEALTKSIAAGIAGETDVRIPGLPSGNGSALASLEKALANPAVAKSLSADVLSAVSEQVLAARAATTDLVKDLTLTNPIAGISTTSNGLVPFDLESPAKYLAPRPTPLRNRIPRKKGLGTSHRYKRITGITGSGTGGVGNTHPGITDGSQTNFANTGSSNSLFYNRGAKITYAGDEFAVPYFQFSLSDQVPWSAQFSGQGFQDIRALSSMSLLYSSMLMEERMLLLGRGTNAAFLGSIATPGAPVVTASNTATGETDISGLTTTLWVKVVAKDGAFGTTVLSATGSFAASSLGSGKVAVATVTDVVGATQYDWYVGTGASEPGTTGLWYAGTTGCNFIRITGAIPTSGVAASTVTTASGGTTAYASGYDGIIPIVSGPNSGYRKRLNAPFSVNNPGVEYQTAFASLYDSVKADPDEVLLSAQDRRQLSDAIKGSTSNNYKLQINQSELSGVLLGDVVIGMQNEATGKRVDLTVHPWMPQGNSAVLSYTLPIPDSQVSDVWSVFNVQDYLGVQWPVNQFAYELSSYWYGTFVCYAPAWNGFVGGIQAA